MAHIHDLIDFTVCVYIVYNNRVLFVYHPTYSMWLTIGGHIELNEDPEEALFREIREETGLEVEIIGTKPQFNLDMVKPLIPPMFLDIHDIPHSNHKHVKLTYFATTKSDDFKLSTEHRDHKWLTHDEILNNGQIREDDKFYAIKALEATSDKQYKKPQ